MGLVQIIIDETASRTLTGTLTFDRSLGGTLIFPSGSSFPVSPVAGEWFWRTDLSKLYYRNQANTTWELATSTAAVNSAKSGSVIPGGFSGTPKKATVTFTEAFADTSYAITLAVITDGTKTFSPSIETKTTGGFVVNLNSGNVANLVEVGWHAMAHAS